MLVLLIELGLQKFSHMIVNSLLSITLHTRINSGINLKTVCIYIIMRAVFLCILITPSIQRVSLPSNTIKNILRLVP